MALLIHFLKSTLLFSSVSPNYERNLKEEIWGCHKYIGFSLDEIMNMPIRDRKAYIQKHNQEQASKRGSYTQKSSGRKPKMDDGVSSRMSELMNGK